MRRLLGSIFRRLPPVARRDAALARLKRRVARLGSKNAELEQVRDESIERFREGFVQRASFQARIHAERRLREIAVDMREPSTSVIRRGKFAAYEFARSHGVETPVEYGRWDRPEDIAWGELPDLVVIKSAFATNSRGVMPLKRSGDGWTVVTRPEPLSDDDLVRILTTAVEEEKVRAPFVAEEFLDEEGTGTRLPTDVKAYAFYGEIPMIVLRRPGRWGEHRRLTPFRVVDAAGRDIEGLDTASLIDDSMPVPANLAEIVEAASRLSVAIRAPFSRIDLYSIGSRIVFGEVTPRPGGSAWHGAIVDELLGDAWDRAQVRLARDVRRGLSPDPQPGPFVEQ